MLIKSRRIVEVKLEDIRLNPSDILPYQSPEQQNEIDRLVRVLQLEGQRQPIRLKNDLSIIDGHLRFFAARRLGWKTVKAIIVSTEKPQA